MAKPSYADNVFLNCPFDSNYDPLLKVMVFTVLHCGFVPRCAKEQQDSGVIRLEKIYRQIESCKYGIHDISRTELDAGSRLPRFNMPFELGVFLGAKRFGGHPNSKKSCLILDRDQYRYQQYISDIAGQDIRAHEGSPARCLTLIRDWLSDQSRRVAMPTGDVIWDSYQLYLSELPDLCAAISQTPHMMTYNDYVRLTANWLKQNG